MAAGEGSELNKHLRGREEKVDEPKPACAGEGAVGADVLGSQHGVRVGTTGASLQLPLQNGLTACLIQICVC